MMNQSPYLKPILNESMIDRIIERIVGMIIAGEYRPGDKIPTEIELGAHLGVGRNSIREAVKVLVYLGVLEIRRAEGTFVCEKSSEKMLNPLLFGLILDGDSSHNILELRRIFDNGALELAASHMTPQKLTVIKAKLDVFIRCLNAPNTSLDEVSAADMAFHRSIEEATDNILVIHVGLVIGKLTQLSRRKTLQKNIESPGKISLTEKRHCAIFEALRRQDTSRIPEILAESYTEWVSSLNA